MRVKNPNTYLMGDGTDDCLLTYQYGNKDAYKLYFLKYNNYNINTRTIIAVLLWLTCCS